MLQFFRNGQLLASLFRRSLGRLAEFLFVCELGEFAGLISGFHAEFFGPSCVIYVLIACASSILFDLVEISTRPDSLVPSCETDEPSLPLGEGK
jgi:hypothetical protein